VIALVSRKTNNGSDSLFGALIFLPFLVQMVIMLVNGSVGTGVAVMGAFSLIRFRSAPGSAQDIAVIFLAMTVGLACGMGCIGLAVLATAVVCGISLIRNALPGGRTDGDRDLKITIPEDMDYSGLFDDLFEKYTVQHSLSSVKTVNMGSLFKLKYRIRLKDTRSEKDFLDELRCRNGNLEISCARVASGKEGKGTL
ncbi:MAG: DUF4956 domain-containing protein, partial [Oscillospiraceae bacterium]|nr:DUF4956 domain-containing protein [Oscillospiraceae bacterium]